MSGSNRLTIVSLFVVAAGVGSLVGVGTAPGGAPVRQAVTAGVSRASVAAGIQRARPPQPGDSWGGCNDARAAGTAPIYAGEPGYRENMDGDGDGIACEPVS
jgi:hypothetical protein